MFTRAALVRLFTRAVPNVVWLMMFAGATGLLAVQRRHVLSILLTVPLLFATARSGLPSPLRSAVMTEEGVVPVGQVT